MTMTLSHLTEPCLSLTPSNGPTRLPMATYHGTQGRPQPYQRTTRATSPPPSSRTMTMTPSHSTQTCLSLTPLNGPTRLSITTYHGTQGHPQPHQRKTSAMSPPPLSSAKHHPLHQLLKGLPSAKSSPRMRMVSVAAPETLTETSASMTHTITDDLSL
jgi:hypothetical protein